MTGLLVGGADLLHRAAELFRIEVIGEQVNVLGDPVHQAVGGRRVAAGAGESVFLNGGQPYASQFSVP
ncbi:MAG: hypothetical protein ACRDSR_28430 [Pseudonocardiaceae bacterium]